MSKTIYPLEKMFSSWANISDPEKKNILEIKELRFNSILSLKTWPDDLTKVKEKLSIYFEGAVLPEVGQYIQKMTSYCICLAPGQFIVLSDKVNLHLEISELINCEEAAITDLSHSRSNLLLMGAKSIAVLNKGLSIALDKNNLPFGSALQSSIHSIGVIILKFNDEKFLILTYSSLVASFFEWIIDASKEFGCYLSDDCQG